MSTGEHNIALSGEGAARWHADWVESYLRAGGIADAGARRLIASRVLAPSPLHPCQVVVRARSMATWHEPDRAAPPAHVPEQVPGTMPVQDLTPLWRSAGAPPKTGAWRTFIHAWAGVVALLLTITDNAR